MCTCTCMDMIQSSHCRLQNGQKILCVETPGCKHKHWGLRKEFMQSNIQRHVDAYVRYKTWPVDDLGHFELIAFDYVGRRHVCSEH